MTPHEINLAIGKSLGFAQCPTAMCQGFPPEYCYRKDTYIGELPDFYGSLDRMHEVERSMTDAQWVEYEYNLYKILEKIYSIYYLRHFIHATSQQRAEAYLKTICTNAPSRQDATVSNPPPSM